MKNCFLKIWNYIKNSWEGADGKLSYRRVSQYIFLVCMVKAGFRPPSNKWEFYVFITFAALYTLVAALLTVQQLLQLLKYTLPTILQKGIPDLNTDNQEEK